MMTKPYQKNKSPQIEKNDDPQQIKLSLQSERENLKKESLETTQKNLFIDE